MEANHSKTYQVNLTCGKLQITVIQGEIPTIFCNIGPCGGCSNSFVHTISELMNLLLAKGASFEDIADVMKNQRCPAESSCSNEIAKVLTAEIGNNS